MWIFLAFVLVPLIEIGLFIQVGGLIGLWPTLGIVLLTAVVGTSLVHSQGARALADLRHSLETLNNPGKPLAHGAMILLAGALLLTPGFFTDTCGILLLIPWVRERLMKHLSGRIKMRGFTVGTRAGGMHHRTRRPGTGRHAAGPVIEGDFEEIEPGQDRKGDSGWTRH